MKKFILSLFVFLPLKLLAPAERIIYIERPKPIAPFENLWRVTNKHETNNNPSAINIVEQAYGIVQIRQCKLDEYNKANNTSYSLQDCLKVAVSKKIFMWHCSKYNDIEYASKRWNGSGPMTEIYWSIIKGNLLKINEL